MNRRTRLFTPLVLVLSLALSSCGSSETAEPEPEFAVVAGNDGVALVGADWLEKVEGIEAPEQDTDGELTARLDGQRAAVVYAGRIAVVQPHQQAIVKDCADCAGVAVTDEFIVTTRRNFTPGNGFDLVLFERDLSTSRVVPAQRLEERVSTDYPGENTESPVTLAADGDRVTVGYLARDGGNRRGPSIIAQYSFEGGLLGNTKVDRVIGRSAASPDGRRLAVELSGSGGYCVNTSELLVVDVGSLQAQKIEPVVPGVSADVVNPWFELTDLQWAGEKLVVAGEVHNPPDGETCDLGPEVWQRLFDPATGAPADSGGHRATAARWVGPGCGEVVMISGKYTEGVLSRGSGPQLGGYYRIGHGRPAPAECARP
ncbi:hypothetical protein [Amycolatopsis nigrescens]|uniref:hypothetical protein n=1 Tax=Amycolatopsis nigrescens TaxID=381445 RepID=UPI000362BF23|nr:hypothetical protein [Amycolatopsis nigrescens]